MSAPLDEKRPKPMFVCGICEDTLFRPTPTGLVCANCQPAPRPSEERVSTSPARCVLCRHIVTLTPLNEKGLCTRCQKAYTPAASVPSETPNTNSVPVSSTLVDGDTPEEIGEGEIEDALITLEHGADSVADVVFAKETIRAAFRKKQEENEMLEGDRDAARQLVEEADLEVKDLCETLGIETTDLDREEQVEAIESLVRARDERVAELERELGDINKIFARYLNTATPGEITELRAEIQRLTSANKRLADNLAYVCKCALDNELEAAQTIQRLKEQQEGK